MDFTIEQKENNRPAQEIFLGGTCYIAGKHRHFSILKTSQNLPEMFVLAGLWINGGIFLDIKCMSIRYLIADVLRISDTNFLGTSIGFPNKFHSGYRFKISFSSPQYFHKS